MSRAPWEADRPLDLAAARAAIAARFPAIDAPSLAYLGGGWEFDAFRTADGWVFRFPRRQDGAALFEREARVHRLVAGVLPPDVALPIAALTGEPGPDFPYRFAAHRFIAGASAGAIDAARLPGIARDLGAFLGAIHAVPPEAARAAGVREPDPDDEGGRRWVERCIAGLDALGGLDRAVDHAVSWLRQESPLIRRFDGPLRFIHGDLAPGHLVVDPASGRLRGVLDWTGSILGDAARDFVFLVTWQGWPFTETVLEHYHPAIDPSFRRRLARSARVLSVLWLSEARERGLGLTNPVQAVRNAFAEEEGAR